MLSKYDEIREKLKNYKERLPKPDPEWPHEVRRAVAFIHKHLFDQRLTVRWMKRQCRIKGNNFSGKFRYYIKETPNQYIQKNRISAAKKILSSDDISANILISNLAYELGFSEASTFSKCFKRQISVIPSNWEKCKEKD